MAQENKIPRTMPYRESEQYIASLVERCTEQAVNSSKSRRITISPAVRIAAVAAAVAVVLTVALHLMGPTGTDSGTTSAPAELTAQVATDDKTADSGSPARAYDLVGVERRRIQHRGVFVAVAPLAVGVGV